MVKALFLLTPDPFSVGMARAWLMSGYSIAAIWFPARLVNSFTHIRDLNLAKTTPGLSMHAIAQKLGLNATPVPQLAAWGDAVDEARKSGCDVIVSSMYPDRIPGDLIDAYRKRVFNIHPSLLPAYRGRYTLLNQLWAQKMDATGVTLHLVDAQFDTGDILSQVHVPFRADRHVASYLMELVKTGGPESAKSIANYLAGKIQPKPQRISHSNAPELKPGKAILDSTMKKDRIKWLCETIPQVTPLFIAHEGQLFSVEKYHGLQKPPVSDSRVIKIINFAAADGSVHLGVRAIKTGTEGPLE